RESRTEGPWSRTRCGTVPGRSGRGRTSAAGRRDDRAGTGASASSARSRRRSRPSVVHAELVEQKPGAERAHHVLRAVREVDDVEEPEDDGEPKGQERVERAVDEPDQELPEQRLGGDPEDFAHRRTVTIAGDE